MLQLLASLEKAAMHSKLTLADSIIVKLFIHDNSGDSALKDVLAERNSKIKTDLYVSLENVGFGAGHNCNLLRAAKEQADYFWVLNSDCYVRYDAISELTKMAVSCVLPSVLGSTIVSSRTGEIETAGGCTYFPLLTYAKNVHEGKRLNELAALQEPTYDYLYGASLFFNKEVIEALDEKNRLFDESYFLYFEEIDFFHQYKSKLIMRWCKNSIVYHEGGASTKSRSGNGHNVVSFTNAVRSALVFSRKNYPHIFFIIVVTSFFLRLIQVVSSGNFALIKTLVRVYANVLLGRANNAHLN